MARLSTLLTVAIGLSGCYAAPGLDCGGGSVVPSVSVPVVSVKPGSSASSVQLSSSAAPSVGPSGTAFSSRLPGTSIALSGSASSTHLPGISVSGSAPSGRPSSIRSSSSSASRSAGSSNGLPSGCADHTTTTRTLTRTTFIDIATSTSTLSGATVTYTPILTIPFTTSAFAFFTENPTVTSTYTVTTSTIVISSISASSTVNVPTPAGFTPVSCLAAYLDPTVTVTETVRQSRIAYVYQTTLSSTGTFYTALYTSTSTRTVSDAAEFTTVTSTRTFVAGASTTTIYEACATNNVVKDGPFGRYFQLPGESEGRLSPGFEVLSPVQCCEYCQANPNCLASSAVNFNVATDLWTCVPFLRRNDTVTCNPSRQAATLALQDTSNFLNLTISNSGCGQYLIGEQV